MVTADTVIAIEAFAIKTHALIEQHLHKVKPEQIQETTRITTQLLDAMRNREADDN